MYMVNREQPSFIPFNQASDVIGKLDFTKDKTLFKINIKYNGLCELICNRILMDDDLGRGRDEHYLNNRVTVERLNEKKIINSHLLEVHSLFCRIIAYLFGVFPDNIFSFWDQWRLVDNTRLVNNEILSKGLRDIKNGETLKLEVFQRGCFNFVGHSLLIKKTESDKYVFFDPNCGEYRGLSFFELSNRINEQIRVHHATNIFITKGTDYLNRLS
jgi:hypothetical protein